MTSTIRIRILWTFLAFAVIVVGLVVSTPYLINTRVVKRQISNQISDWMGLPVRVRGEPVVTILPYLTIKLNDVQVASKLGRTHPPLAAMHTLKAEMYWLPLIFGRFEVRRFHLVEPVFEFIRDEQGNSSWDVTGGSLLHNKLGENRLILSNVQLGNFRITRGVAHYKDQMTDREENLSDINLSFDWPRTEAPASIVGTTQWRGRAVKLSAQSKKPMELFAGGLSPLSLSLSSPLFSMSLSGSAATMSNFQFEGDFAFRTPSVQDLLVWLKRDVPTDQTLGAASLKARANLVGASIAFSNMDLVFEDNHANGVLQLDFRRERPFIQGTLASDELDFGPYLKAAERLRDIEYYNLLSQDLGYADVDVRLSATKLTLGQLEMSRAATSLMTRNNEMSFSISEAYTHGGRLEASFDMRQSNSNKGMMNCNFRTKANGVSAGSLTRQILGNEILTGTALIEADLQGSGKNLHQIMDNTHGTLSVVLTQGDLDHFSLDKAQAAIEGSQDKKKTEFTNGRTRFDVLSVRGKIIDRALDVEGLRLTSGNRALVGTAQVGLADQTIDFPGTLSLYRSSDPATHSTEQPKKNLPFLISGPLSDPKITARKPDDPAIQPETDILAPGVPLDMSPGREPAALPEAGQPVGASDPSALVTPAL
ncbi:AsmA family protein [uncultured Cohaesibacter sp.]|uniref:AsmA family protein n=1 Tax=uncultured Cohaesibacter sp. TaxID=1002546 RepID=UPI00293104C3|nr:AsmA family protein [uncultured Cohaesibacter sp.]